MPSNRHTSPVRRGNLPDVLPGYAQDENVKAMRETAEQIGLTQVLRDVMTSPAMMGHADIMRVSRALALLGDESYS